MIPAPPPSLLLVIDFQSRLMPSIAEGAEAVAHARRLLDIAALLDVPVVYTEENPAGLGRTVADLAPAPSARVLSKMYFDAWREPDVRAAIPDGMEIVVVGCEAHVCVLQTVLGLRSSGRSVKVVRDAIGSRRIESRDAAIARMDRHGAEIVTAEMVAFEWLVTAEHPRFKDVIALVK
ncbi:isochorismatase family protein [uncultured Enterovirga sp.]|uniref:isochorismatase family protein n=1 Tax=uncultured Enterovirga sp. TaxID=2026352 RepID=UPI0035CA4029